MPNIDYTALNCREFAAILSSKAPTPGGGGAAALCGVLGIALGNMVMNLTIGKKKYAPVEAELRALLGRSETLMQRMCELINEDAMAFEPLARAYTMPNKTSEEQSARSSVMESALLQACQTPLEIMKTCAAAIDIIGIVACKGTPMALSDAGAGMQLCMCAMKTASLNIYINAAAMTNRDAADSLIRQADNLIAGNEQKAGQVTAYVDEKLRVQN